MAKSKKLIEVKLSHDEICDLINGLTLKGISQALDKKARALGRKLSKGLKELEKGNGKKA